MNTCSASPFTRRRSEVTLDELDLELDRKYGGYIDVQSKDGKTIDTIVIDGWYSLEELESLAADIKQWQTSQQGTPT